MPAIEHRGRFVASTAEDNLWTNVAAGATPTETSGRRAFRTVPDDLYQSIPISRWAQTLLQEPEFQRLRDVSLSDIPGSILFGRAFPSRLIHSLGVYYLARLSRPRDRALQAAALAHDIGHGPFSHLSEPLMVERLGMDHETRSVALFRRVIMRANRSAARLLNWLDIDEVGSLISASGNVGRAALLNGRLDYDNLDHVARFMRAAELGEPMHDGRVVARGLRLVAGPNGEEEVALTDDLWSQARAWQTDRAVVFQFLQSDPMNGAAHGMLRKAIDLAAVSGHIDGNFFDFTDGEALVFLRACPDSRTLVGRILARQPYQTTWEGDVLDAATDVATAFARAEGRLALEARIAMESGLSEDDVVVTFVVSRVERPLPPLLSRMSEAHAGQRVSEPPERFLRVLTPPGLASDYVRRAQMAIERILGGMGARSRVWPDLR
ncbi:MAG TPA: HD domain-containing protein [Ktedonobacterales bacterium]